MSTKPTILLVEDDVDFRCTVSEELSPHYLIEECPTGKKALSSLTHFSYAAIILDVGLPDISGISLCKQIRELGVIAPIIILSGKMEVTTKVSALDAGADDYLTKPCSIAELHARIEAQCRRATLDFHSKSVLTYGDLEIDRSSRRAWYKKQPINLRRKEYDVLEVLMLNRNHVVTRDKILELAWDSNVDLFTNSIDVHISKLRQKIDHQFGVTLIQTVYGFGYRLLLNLGSTNQ